MKRILAIFLLMTLSGLLSGQQASLSQGQLNEIKAALQRIAVSNNVVENILYDGMTYEEVLKILRIQDLDVQGTSFDNYQTMV